MASLKKLPSPLTILAVVILIAAVATWLMPAGEYDSLASNTNSFTISSNGTDKSVTFTQHTLDSLKIRIPIEKFKNGDIRKPVAIPGTYHPLKNNRQGFLSIVQAPVKGIYDSIDVILFVLFIGGFIAVFQQTGAMEQGISYLSYRMKGKEAWLIIPISFFFVFCGAAEGMAEEGFAFYPILIPLYLAAGYDLLVPVAVIFAGTSAGNMASFCNPFATIIASNAAGISWTDGLYERLLYFALTAIITIGYIVFYAQRVKKNPALSFVHRFDGNVTSAFEVGGDDKKVEKLELKNTLLIILFLATIAMLIFGVVKLDWWLTEMSALFVVSSILIAVITRMNEGVFIEKFVDGMKTMISVALIIGVARGVTMILNDGHITGTILFYSASLAGKMPAVVFIVLMLFLYMVFSLFIASSSGMAVLTMPIFGSLAVIVGVPGKEIVNAYLWGIGIMGFITPVGLLLPALGIANVSLKAFWRFIYPLLAIFVIMSIIFLVVGVL